MNKNLIRYFLVCLPILLILSAACSPSPDSVNGNVPAAPEPADTDIPVQQCVYLWSTKYLPDLSLEIQQAMQDANLRGIEVIAEAYGENCLASETNEVVYFAPMETDFRITARVESLKDRQNLGNLLEEILKVLDAFPPGATPGPNPGYIGVTFQSGGEELLLWFTVTDGESARTPGTRGEALLDELEKK